MGELPAVLPNAGNLLNQQAFSLVGSE